MGHSRLKWPLLALIGLLASCASAPKEGRYVEFVSEVMAASATLPHTAAQRSSEPTLRAVAAWRAGQVEQSSGEASSGSGGGGSLAN